MSRPRCLLRRLLWLTSISATAISATAFLWIGSQSFADTPLAVDDPGPVLELSISSAGEPGKPAPLRGQDGQGQLVVMAKYAKGIERDVTRSVSYRVAAAGIVRVDPTGLCQTLNDGTTTITAVDPSGKTAEIKLTVTNYHEPLPVNFPNQVTPLFTKFGCNGGGCHGKASGQNGFKLSLLGFEPGEDFEHLVHESHGRRLAPAAPDISLLLTKATNASPHGGGQRLETDSVEYRLLRRWIAQGMPYGKESDPKIVRIGVSPDSRTLVQSDEQQLVVTAYYSDGSMEDVTRAAQFDINVPNMGEVSKTGLVQANGAPGNMAVMIRYQGLVAVFRGTVPLGVRIEQLPPQKNFVDRLVFEKLQRLGMPPSAVCDDATFLRRVTIDLAGRLPKIDETQQFMSDTDPHKRDKLVDRLVDSGDYADYFANKWSSVLRNRRKSPTYTRGTYGFHAWIRQSLYENKPYDAFVREILAASGEMSDSPAVAWYREVKDIDQQVENTAQLFLGLRIQCARCHHHPFEAWSQRDYYGFSAFFSQVGRKPGAEADEESIYHKRGMAKATNPKTGESISPTSLGGAPFELLSERDPRQVLVDWMAEPTNKFFAPALVNRYWKHFFGRGIVDPEDDMRVTNPATNPELLENLAQHFIRSKFDLKDLVRTICKSTTYQLSAVPNQHNAKDLQNFSRYYPKRLNAEVLLDAVDYVAGSATNFTGLPAGSRAVQIPDNGVTSYFLTVFGKPEGESACECERSTDASLAQCLHLLNSPELQGKLSAASGRAVAFSKDKAAVTQDQIRQIYLVAFSRAPQSDELAAAEEHIGRAQTDEARKRAFENILWALVNTKEFLFNH